MNWRGEIIWEKKMNDEESFYDTPEWELERYSALKDWDGTCERCGDITESPHVHHVKGLNYNDYEILCPECHADHHGDDEIAEYQTRQPCCKKCGKTCDWKELGGKWKLTDRNGNLHICKGLKEEARAISNSINQKRKMVQKPLF